MPVPITVLYFIREAIVRAALIPEMNRETLQQKKGNIQFPIMSKKGNFRKGF
jgi:hypothetical protein